jgi:hypothetical protein
MILAYFWRYLGKDSPSRPPCAFDNNHLSVVVYALYCEVHNKSLAQMKFNKSGALQIRVSCFCLFYDRMVCKHCLISALKHYNQIVCFFTFT